MVAAGKSGAPVLGAALGASGEIGAEEFVEASAAQAEFSAGVSRGERFGPEATQHISDKRSGMASRELAVVFIRGTCPPRVASAAWRQPPLRSG